MSKIVKTVIEVGIGIGLMALSGGLAGIGIAGVMSAGTLATAVTGLGLGLALMGAETLVTKTPSLSNSLSDRLAMNYDTTAARAIVFGTTAADTALRFKETYGKNNDRMALVIANASHRLSAVKAIYLDSVLSYSGALTGKYAGGIERLQPVLEGTASNGSATGTGTYWTSRSTFTGCAYTFLTYKLDQNKVWTDGLPQKITTVANGCPLYDPRRDGTNGGSGSMRPDNQSTWAFTAGGVDIGRNPALALLTYIIGYRINGILAWGMGVSLDRINIQNFIEYANLCEEQIATANGGTTQRYTCDGIFSTNDTHETVINTICASMGTALLIDLDGLYQFVGGFDDTLTTPMAFTADDVMSGGVWSPSPAVRDRFNIIAGRFADPAQLYELDDWGSIEVDPLFDNVPRTQTVDLGCVNRAETCQRIAKQMLVREKYSGTYTAVFGPRAFGVSVGSLLTLSLPQFGWEEKLFRVTDQSESYELLYQMTLREESPEIYAWDENEGKSLPTTELTDIYDPIVAADVMDLAIDARTVDGTNSVSTIFIDVSWTPSSSLRVGSIEIQSQVPGAADWGTEAERYDDVGTFTFPAGVDGAGINVRARYRMSNGATGDWSNATLGSTPVSTVNQWSSVYDDGDGSKPEDGATKGAPSGTVVGGIPADDVAGAVTDRQGNIVKIVDIQADVAAAQSDIDDLFETYGDTASAQQAKVDAQAARDGATAAQASAVASAQTAAEKADDADGFAETASGQATIATQKATDAGQSASNAAASSETAATKAGEAGVSAQHAAASESNALGYSNSASASSVVSASSADAAVLATAAAFPRDFASGIQFWGNLTGSPQTQTQPSNWSNPYGGSAGAALRITDPTQNQQVRTRNLISTSLARRTFRIIVTVRLATPPTSAAPMVASVNFYGLGGDYQTIFYSGYLDQITSGGENSRQRGLPADGSAATVVVQGRVIATPACPWVAPSVYISAADGASSMAGAKVDILSYVVEDVTDSEAASDSASAAAQSESTAAAKATDAGNSASAANQAKLDAQVANDNSQSAAGSASDSATTATSQAAAAAASASLAASYQTGAQNALALTFPNSFDPVGRTAFSPDGTGGYQGPSATWPSPYAWLTTATTHEQHIFTAQPVPKKPGARYSVTSWMWSNDSTGAAIACGNYEANLGSSGTVANIPRGTWQKFYREWNSDDYPSATSFSPYCYWKTTSGADANGSFYVIGPFIQDITQSSEAASSAAVSTNQAAIATAQASNASTSESTAAGYANDAKGYRDSSSSSATTATNQASVATAEAAAAKESATLAASVSVGAITLNPTFADWADGQPYPTAWGGVAGATKVAGENGSGNGYRLPGAANTQAYATGAATPAGSIVTNGYYVVEADFRLNAGTLVGAGVLFRVYNTSGTYDDNRIPFATDPSNNTGVALGNGVVGQTYRLRKMIKVATANASYTVPFAMSHWSVMGSIAAANDITWYRCSVRAASDAEIKTGQIDALNASVTTNTGAIASIEDTAAYWETVAEASGGNPAKVRLYAGKNGSAIDLVSDVVAIQNDVDGTLMTVASFDNGQARLNDALVRNLHVAPRSDSDIYLAVQLKPLVFLASHGQVVQYQGGASFGVAPDRITVDTSSLPALDSGEAYDVRAISITDKQFTARIVKSTPSGTTIDTTAAGTNVGGTPQWRCNKADATNAYNGYYSFSVTATIPFFGAVNRGLDNAPDWRYSYQGSVDVYGYYAGAWHKLATITLSRSYTSDQGASVTITQSQAVYSDAAFGTGTQVFGVSPTSGAGTTITAFPGVSYSIRTASGETPVAGQLPFTVYPPPADG